ncbi:Intradiol ring-cleavage dioxygenase [Leptodontidium sp. MPI-SDFR-AT-0119]|nr:Intradiol ring-cleavage dioxygenase [Leptodontidium sp. MPI-SDFR-AT-0119]
MKFFTSLVAAIAMASSVAAHPSKHNEEERDNHDLVGRGSDKCAAQLEARKEAFMAKRAESLFQRREAERNALLRRGLTSPAVKRDQYTTIQNDTCVLAPDVVWGPYGVDGEIYRHDIREDNSGVNLYLDIGVIDIETCEPLPDAYLTIWHCNATGYYSGFTGIDPDTAELTDGATKMSNGLTDNETFLRGIMTTSSEGVAEFLTVFPGYYTTRATHIHLTVQASVADRNSTSYSTSAVQHIGQLFFDQDLINSVYELDPYAAHLDTLDIIQNVDDKLYTSANAGGYSSVISVTQLGDSLSDGLVGYITVGVNASAAGIATTGGSVNPLGVLPTVSVAESVRAAATSVDVAAGYGAAATGTA